MMSDPKYRAAIVQACRSRGARGRRWPPYLKGHGRVRHGQPLGHCVVCGPKVHPAMAGTWTTYGGDYICYAHARALGEGAR